ncbi:thiamine biosynthesis protein ThiS [Nocardiopsis sp. CNR-923]|uniref:MoaD/ThiS family protein n=1 Tax=Nocardiopsis sp. CNR-923 TaxID=1904965 RepID=UPI000965656F|nr:MoaD/ThiS family protein [Nocardiopsis sp. CNR-923]OLT29946.1 thiamine biosynthesis protein ThiS [Nocardiopsis sp. CNR-923]
MVTVVLSSAWTQGRRSEFEVAEGSLREVLRALAENQPDYRHRLLDGSGEPLEYFNVYVDDEFIPRRDRSRARVRPGTTVTIVPPLAGG